MTTITKDMLVGEIIRIDQGLIAILMNVGMGCVGCPSAQGETLEQACMVHGIQVEPIVEQMNEYLASK